MGRPHDYISIRKRNMEGMKRHDFLDILSGDQFTKTKGGYNEIQTYQRTKYTES